MKILIVEDQVNKRDEIISYIKSRYNTEVYISQCQSLRSGLSELMKNDPFDLIFLDMSMPNFDPSPDDPVGGTPESFAGEEFMDQMSFMGIFYPVIVITQYSSFEKGQISLSELHEKFKNKYNSFYKGYVYYDSASDTWKKELEIILGRNLK